MRIAVTGGNGELGRSLIPYLLEQGHAVVSIDRALPAVHNQLVTALVADTRNFGELAACLRDCDALVHLAAHRSPMNHPDSVVYIDNTAGSYNALSAAATLGITHVCLASSINAIGGAFSRAPRYDYFPLDEQHPTYNEDPYSLSKWICEQQADSFVRRYEQMRIASLRFHWVTEDPAAPAKFYRDLDSLQAKHLWAWTHRSAAARACLLGVTADFRGHEVFFIVAPTTVVSTPSLELVQRFYPGLPVRGDLSGTRSFFDSSKAERLLGWNHDA